MMYSLSIARYIMKDRTYPPDFDGDHFNTWAEHKVNTFFDERNWVPCTEEDVRLGEACFNDECSDPENGLKLMHPEDPNMTIIAYCDWCRSNHSRILEKEIKDRVVAWCKYVAWDRFESNRDVVEEFKKKKKKVTFQL